MSKPGLPIMRKMWTYWSEFIKRIGATVVSGEAERTGVVQPGQEKTQRDLPPASGINIS